MQQKVSILLLVSILKHDRRMQKKINKYLKSTGVYKCKFVFALHSFCNVKYFCLIRAMKNTILSLVFPHSNYWSCWDHFFFSYGWTEEKDKEIWQHFLGCWSQQDDTVVLFQPACSGMPSRALQNQGIPHTGIRMLLLQHPGVQGLCTMFAALIQGSNLTAGTPMSSCCSHVHETTLKYLLLEFISILKVGL